MNNLIHFCRTTAALVMILMMGQPVLAGTYLVQLGSTDFTMTIDDAYCQLDETIEFDRRFADFQRRSNRGQNHYVDGYLMCRELQALRGGTAVDLSRWIIILSPMQGNSEIRPLSGMSRNKFLSEMETQFRKGVEIDHEAISKNVNRAAEEVTGQAVTSPIEIEPDGQPYFLHRSDNAVFAGIKMQVGNAQQTLPVGGVFAMTLVDNYMASIYVFSQFNRPDTMNRLLGETSLIMRSVAN